MWGSNLSSYLEDAIRRFGLGEFVIVTDDTDRENEGDLFLLASAASTEKIGFMIRYTSGVLCVAMTEARSRELHLPLMVKHNQDTKRTAFTVTVDVKHGISTGISAEERANTIRALASKESTAEDFIRPGHIFPLIAHEGGLSSRRGHTEAIIEICRRANQELVGVICELVNEDGSMMRGEDLKKFASSHDIPIITIEELAKQVTQPKAALQKITKWAQLPRPGGEWRIATFTGKGGVLHAVCSLGNIEEGPQLVRVHSECLTGDVLGSLRCDCGAQLEESFKLIENSGSGLVIYLREQEGRGIGLEEKMRAYQLQDEGLDTVEANLALGHEIDERDFIDAVEIIKALKINEITLLTNNPDKLAAFESSEIKTHSRPLPTKSNPHNLAYLKTKRDRLGHILLENHATDRTK
jgi:3,4-dihydroxy 2-butanone 4-phosphate synthase/GTP cyclohydrolase II